MNLQSLLNNPPNLHRDSAGNAASWQLDDAALVFIDGIAAEGSRTLETGAGLSTILFGIKHSYHTCINPDDGQAGRIMEYCEQHSIPTDRLSFVIDGSESALPRLQPKDLDLVLIDGRHAFPTPFIDWYYTAMGLSIGGICIIDDTHLWTGQVLREFLQLEPEWRLVRDFARTSAFAKVANGTHEKEWVQQPYLRNKSASGIRREQLRFAAKLLRMRQLSTLIGTVRRLLREHRLS
jgi:hypothetical protein